jgi:hypothetical protein
VTGAAFVTAMVCAYTEKSQLPWYALIVGLIFAFLWLPFYGSMMAVTGCVLCLLIHGAPLTAAQIYAVRPTAIPDARLGRCARFVASEHVL